MGTAAGGHRQEAIGVLVVDDHPVVRAGLVQVLGAALDIEVIGSACDGVEAVAAAIATSPDVVVMDMSMPNLDGAEATRGIRAAVPGASVVILTAFSDRLRLAAATRAGAAACVLKDAEPAVLLEAVRSAAAGRTTKVPL